MHQPQAYFNGRWIAASQLAISPADAGFVQGTTVAEQLRAFHGRLYRLEEHLRRLFHGLELIGVDPGVSLAEMAGIAEELAERNHRLLAAGDDLGMSIFVTPGLYPAYCDAPAARPTLSLHTYPLPFHLWAEKYQRGQALVTTEIQQVPPACWPPQLKCRSRMHYYLADRRAAQIEAGARALLLDQQGCVTEASTANIAVYTATGGLVTPPAASVLRGISLITVEELARRMGIEVSERPLRVDDVAAAEEALLCSTPFAVLSVTRLNGRPIGAGKPGPVFQEILRQWSDLVGVDIAAQAVRFARR